jgi:hypothetical protein
VKSKKKERKRESKEGKKERRKVGWLRVREVRERESKGRR